LNGGTPAPASTAKRCSGQPLGLSRDPAVLALFQNTAFGIICSVTNAESAIATVRGNTHKVREPVRISSEIGHTVEVLLQSRSLPVPPCPAVPSSTPPMPAYSSFTGLFRPLPSGRHPDKYRIRQASYISLGLETHHPVDFRAIRDIPLTALLVVGVLCSAPCTLTNAADATAVRPIHFLMFLLMELALTTGTLIRT